MLNRLRGTWVEVTILKLVVAALHTDRSDTRGDD